MRPLPSPGTPWAALVRASLALAIPLAVGLAAGQPAYGALAAMGGLSGVIGDTADAYRMRILNIAVPQLFGAVGVTLGTLVYGHGWVAVAALTALALISGMISSVGAVASVSGLLLILNAVVGAGLPMPDPWWTAPLLMTLGGLLVLLLTLLAWPWRGGAPERTAVAATYREVAALLEAAGTSAYPATRQDVSRSLNASYDLILARRTREHGRRSPLVRVLAQLNALIPLIEAAPAAHVQGKRLPPEIPSAVRVLADAVERGEPTADRRTEHAAEHAAVSACPAPRTPAGHAVDHALRHAATVVLAEDPDPYNIDDRLGRPAALRIRVRRALRNVLRSGASWRYGLRLAVCIGLAQCLVSLIEVPRSYWVTLTVVFVMKPDFGSVFSRAVLRAIGTAVGLVLAAVVLSELSRGWWDVPVMLVLAALIPLFSVRGYAYQTAAITPVILLLSDLLNHQGFGLVLPRLWDSLIGCAITLLAGYLLWPETWHTRVGSRLAKAVHDTADYLALAFADPPNPANRTRRTHARRTLYKDLMTIRTEFQRALTEPPPMGRSAAAWWPLAIAVERIVDATTAARVRVDHGAPPPPAPEVAALTAQLRDLAEGLTTAATPPAVREDRPGATEPADYPEAGVLAPLHQEVLAARAIATPGA
ncbi:FUSC family protein [Streptomyces sp. NPDC048442]|uniref:FUSC family protein n=1 Tax=Streptomyces sp. NPDC048442 TaxID=3154823 RepID=UPI00344A315D